LIEWTFNSCSGDAGSHSEWNSSRTRVFATPGAWKIAAGVFAAFKIWENVDLWSYSGMWTA